MNNMGSEFLPDITTRHSDFLRRVCFGLGVVLGTIVTIIIELFKLDPIIYWLFNVVIAFPMIIYGLGVDEKLQLSERYRFFFIEKIRLYQTQQDEE